MPRGYQLTSYYDAQRAMHRRLYSEEFKKLSSQIKKFGFYNYNVYSLLIDSLNNGIYDTLAKTELLDKCHHYSSSDVGQSHLMQDFMSPLELRLNSLAVRKARNALEKATNYNTIDDLRTLCYRMGAQTAKEFLRLKFRGNGVYNLEIKSPVLSSVPIVKKYNSALLKGTIPQDVKIEYRDIRQQERQTLITANTRVFDDIKDKLFSIGCDPTKIALTFANLNLGYYAVSPTSTLELASLLKSGFDATSITHAELSMNLEKLTMLKNALKNVQAITNTNDYYKFVVSIGAKARDMAIEQYKMLPEVFSGFYNLYSRSEQNKLKAQQIHKQNDSTK